MKITISREGQQLGPYSVEEINARLRTGELTLHNWAWIDGASDWMPLESIVGIDGTDPSAPVAAKPASSRVATAAPVAVKPHVPSAVPVVVNPSVSHTPSAQAVAAKPKWRFNGKAACWIIGFVIVIGWACSPASANTGEGPALLFLIFVGFVLWYVNKDSKKSYSRLQQERAKELEQMRERVRLKMQRLLGDGAPYIEGQIIRLAGVSGLAKGSCALRFESSHASIFLAHGKALTLPYGDIQLLQIGGKGRLTESVDNAFIGGGFGLVGALEGAAVAGLLNAAVSVLTRNERIECELLLRWTTGELLMLNQEITPEMVSHVLQPIIKKLG
jgi:hypothetical protein